MKKYATITKMTVLILMITSLVFIGWGVKVFLKKRNGTSFESFSYQSSHDQEFFSLSHIKGKDNLVPFLVLGSGPAALSAALYGARAKIKTVVLRGNKPGGQLTGTSYIENWPGVRKVRGTEVVQSLQEQAERFGALMVNDVASSIDVSSWPYKVTTEEGRVLYAMAIMVGTGSTPRRLGVIGEEELWGKGVTTCAICDAPYHKGDHVVVVGGGDSAMEEAIELAAYAAKVSVLVRTSVLKASPSMVERALGSKNVEILYNKKILEIHGANEKVSGITIQDTATREQEELRDVKGVFLAIGHDPNTSFIKDHVACSETGHIQVGPQTQWTSLPGVVAAGDVSDDRYKQAGVAAGDGIKAGLDVVWWLSELGYNDELQEALTPFIFSLKNGAKVHLLSLENKSEYEDVVRDMSDDTILLLDFFTPYCPSCMHMMPVLEWVVQAFDGKLSCYKIDASMAFDLVSFFKIKDVPTLIVIKKGKVLDVMRKELTRAQMHDYLKKFL